MGTILNHAKSIQTSLDFKGEGNAVDPGSLADLALVEDGTGTQDHVIPSPEIDPNNQNCCPLPHDHIPEDFEPNFVPHLEDIKISKSLIDMLRNASLNGKLKPLDPEFVDCLRNPPTKPLDLSDRDERLSIELFLANSRTSEDTYTECYEAVMRAFPDARLLSLHEVKKRIEEITGVVTIWRDMCPGGCLAYTGPFAKLESCSGCGESRYKAAGKKGVARQQYPTVSVGPMVQGLNRTYSGAEAMDYCRRYTEQLLGELRDNGSVRKSPFHDFFDGSDYLNALRDGKIGENDICLMMSIDGAQLYRNKTSDYWMWIWLILDLDPLGRYKVAKVIPGGSIPGPNKPKHLDSFIFPSLYHIAALAREGLKIWKANRDLVVTSSLFLALVAADSPGMACLNGLVGHQGHIHCHSFCGIAGRRKDCQAHYYRVHLKPVNYAVEGSSHDDVDLFTLLASHSSGVASERYHRNPGFLAGSINKTQYEKRRLETGICKPSIFSGFPKEHVLGIPHIFSSDIMHLPCLNIPDLMIPLWRGKFESTWKAHGDDVARCTPFDRPPRNPAEKISSGYKAWEFLLYFYSLGPCLFYGHLPTEYWKSYCRLVCSIQISLQVEITPEEANTAFDLCCQFSDEFEKMYYQRRPDRIHMVWPAIHALSHIALDLTCIGPGIIYSQWTMERNIGFLGELILQHLNPYANLAARLIRLAQVNVLKAMDPKIQTEHKSPEFLKGSVNLGDGYTLRRAKDTAARHVSPVQMNALRLYFRENGVRVEDSYCQLITCWARVGLPNGQIARSRWKEETKPLDRVRMA
ncbi:hypothetical protein AAF712_013158 [Marasmius tenuissimus]|uniref:Transposase family Tnp2 protein n=1 Tax=Marasmius tenuissimus TaxID=585030 RepID=A0ABR2ZGC0_9AGAR